MPILASLNAKNRSKSPFSIGVPFSIISDFTVLYTYLPVLVGVGHFREKESVGKNRGTQEMHT
jgi:hypothetical protein